MAFMFRLYIGRVEIMYDCCLILGSLVQFTNTCLPDLQNGKRLMRSTFKIIEHSSLFACAAECAAHGLCKSFQLESGPRPCHLNDLQIVEGGWKEADFIYSSIMNWNETRLGPCQNTQCGITERCILKRNGNVRCDTFLPNIAKGKPASASSTWPFDAVPPGAAVDGDVNAAWASGSCFATNNGDFSPWWQVDFQDTYIVVEVRVTSRIVRPERLHDFSIDVYRIDPVGTPGVSPQLCYMYDGAVTEPGMTVAVQCTSRVTGRYMRLCGKKTINTEDVFQFCEVQVFGFTPLQWWCSSEYHVWPPPAATTARHLLGTDRISRWMFFEESVSIPRVECGTTVEDSVVDYDVDVHIYRFDPKGVLLGVDLGFDRQR
ncbi:uncharacterized protein [Haliotis asinina]|uniref:uncharacterized protein n=1 Tax=Haliotis asinina TaxID=109174 RepID=UPI0035319216